ncbi:histidine phosphatase family protein [Paenibacillus hodogayensis]|uniref:Histidine phosphatase family protein n=1 Tax=Paenibacillus hodogayensis TaxID=279208 RepID=A0ABV5VTV8_9BACL
MTIRIYIVRHAQPASQEPGYPGGPNPPLGQKGRMQAERVGRQMSQWGIDALYSSCMQRTLETARPIRERTGVPWSVWPALGETDRRGWPVIREKLARGESPESPEQIALRREHPNHVPLSALGEGFGPFETNQPFPWPEQWWLPLENETREQTYERADEAIRHLLRLHRGDGDIRIAVICHGAFGSVLLTRLMQCPPSDSNLFNQAHAAISAVDLFDDSTQLRFLNYVGHLSPDEVTEGVNFDFGQAD